MGRARHLHGTLTVDGKSFTQPITVKADPRVKTPPLVMQQVYSLSEAMYFGALDTQAAAAQLSSLRAAVAERRAKAQGTTAQALEALDRTADALSGASAAGGGRGGRGGGAGRGGAAAGPAAAQQAESPRGSASETLATASAALSGIMNSLQGADVKPTAIQLAGIASARQLAARVMTRWNSLKGPELAALNLKLKAAGLDPIAVK